MRYLRSRFVLGVPVARGAATPLTQTAPTPLGWIHGDNGLGNFEFQAIADATLDPRPAYRLIIDTAHTRPGEVTLLAVGPFTYLAFVLDRDPDVAQFVRQVVIMGGAFGTDGVFGNVTSSGDANVLADPEAADRVLSAPWPVTIVELDVTQRKVMANDWPASIRGGAGEPGRFVWDVSRHYVQFHKDSAGLDGVYVHDSSAVAWLLAPHLYATRSGHVRVLTDGIAAGLTLQNLAAMRVAAPHWDARPACAVCVGVDAAGMLDPYRRTLPGAL